MKMMLRVEGDWVDLGATGFEHLGKEFHDNLPDILEHGMDEDDDPYIDLPITGLDELYKYLHAFKDFIMVIFVSENSEEIKVEYSLCNKKSRHYDGGEYIHTRTEVKRDVVTKKLNDRVLKAIEILQEGRFDFGNNYNTCTGPGGNVASVRFARPNFERNQDVSNNKSV